MLGSFARKWNQYKYRFVPWVALNLKNRSVRNVEGKQADKVISSAQAYRSLVTFLTSLYNASKGPPGPTGKYPHHCEAQPMYSKEGKVLSIQNSINMLQKYVRMCAVNEHIYMKKLQAKQSIDTGSKYVDAGQVLTAHLSCQSGLLSNAVLYYGHDVYKTESHFDKEMNAIMKRQYGDRGSAELGLAVMKEELGFVIERAPSVLPGGGTGVKVTQGTVPPNSVVALYPGTIYRPGEPVLLQSLRNPFVFRCIDSILIDGNDKFLSRFLYRSCAQRDRVGPQFTCDMSWLTQHPANPMAVGQYVNNHNKEYPANVAYQEFDVPEDFPFPLRQYLPNVHYSADNASLMRLVLLVSIRQINEGEELFSSYFTIVH